MRYPKIDIKVDEVNRVVIGFALGKEVKSVARCAKEDIFDARFGVKLVTARVKKTCAKLKLAELKRIKASILKQIDQDIASTEAQVRKQENRILAIKLEKYPEEILSTVE